jgi:hypothetical protein
MSEIYMNAYFKILVFVDPDLCRYTNIANGYIRAINIPVCLVSSAEMTDSAPANIVIFSWFPEIFSVNSRYKRIRGTREKKLTAVSA